MIDEKTDQPKPLAGSAGAFDDLEHVGVDDRENCPILYVSEESKAPRARMAAYLLRHVVARLLVGDG
jgi:hypothetical protein